MFYLKDHIQEKSKNALNPLHIYSIDDFEITFDASNATGLDNRSGFCKNTSMLPPNIPELSANECHINPCGPGLLGLRNAIKELFTNQIYKLILGYAPDTFILYDNSRSSFYRVSRHIADSKIWSQEYSGRYAINDFEILENGTLRDQHGKECYLYGYASIGVIAFLLGEGDMHAGQILVQRDEQRVTTWKIDNEYSFACQYPVTLENLDILPFYSLQQLGIYKYDIDQYKKDKAEGRLTEKDKFKLLDNDFRTQFQMSGLPLSISQSETFNQEKIAAFQKIIEHRADFATLLEFYCDINNHDLISLKQALSEAEYADLPKMLHETKIQFSQWLERFKAPEIMQMAYPVAALGTRALRQKLAA